MLYRDAEKIHLAKVIATAAHGARGMKRADGVTPYITHPARVVELLQQWDDQAFMYDTKDEYKVLSAAWLHDVIEDTRLDFIDLINLGVDHQTMTLVDLLTKENDNSQAESKAYFKRIAEDHLATVIKTADRCANLEDAFSEVRLGNGLRRWKRYVDRTSTDMLPILFPPERLSQCPVTRFLYGKISVRLELIAEALERVDKEAQPC
jgi:(p)ppGpp synthase/HD superfamily hydrolase